MGCNLLVIKGRERTRSNWNCEQVKTYIKCLVKDTHWKCNYAETFISSLPVSLQTVLLTVEAAALRSKTSADVSP